LSFFRNTCFGSIWASFSPGAVGSQRPACFGSIWASFSPGTVGSHVLGRFGLVFRRERLAPMFWVALGLVPRQIFCLLIYPTITVKQRIRHQRRGQYAVLPSYRIPQKTKRGRGGREREREGEMGARESASHFP